MTNIILWDKYETSLLIEKYLEVEKNEISFFEAVSSLSKELRMLAEDNGIEIDNKFRNENGINMQMNVIKGLMNNDKRGLKNSSKMFKDMVWMYKFRRSKFDKILMEAKMMIDNKNTIEMRYFDWLSSTISNNKIKEMVSIYKNIENIFLSLGILKDSLFNTKDIKIICEIMQTIDTDEMFKISNSFIISDMSIAIKYYYNWCLDNPKFFINEKRDFLNTNDAYGKLKLDIKTLNENIISNAECLKMFIDYCNKSKIYKVYEIDETDFVAFKKAYDISHEDSVRLKEFILNLNKDISIINLSFDTKSSVYMENSSQCDSLLEKSIDDVYLKKEYILESYSNITHDKNMEDYNTSHTISGSIKNNEEAENDLFYNIYDNFNLDSSIEDVELTVRAYNCLKNNGIKKISDLMEYSDDEIRDFKNLGDKTFKEINNIIDKIKGQELDKSCEDRCFDIKLTSKLNIAIRKTLFNNESFDLAILTNDELRIYNKLKLAAEEIGYDMCYYAFCKPKNTIAVLNSIHSFIDESVQYARMEEKLRELYLTIKPDVKNREIRPYIEAYLSSKIKKEGLLKKLCNSECKYIHQLNEKFLDSVKEQELFAELCDFLKFLNIDINDYVNNFFDELFKKQRNYTILSGRANGRTLEEIGTILGLTRERVRQIESKIMRKYNFFNDKINIMLNLCAIFNGDSVIKIDEIKKVINLYTDELIYLLKTASSSQYHYNKDLDVFVIGNVDYLAIKNRIDILPNYIFDSEIDNIVNEISNEMLVPNEIFHDTILKKYKFTGRVYHKTSISLTYIYEITLKNYYPHGIKLFDDNELERFRLYVNELFGDIKLPKNNRAIETRIAEIGVLCDRGMYIHKDYIKIDNKQIEIIDMYIQDSERSAISFLELYEKFKNELSRESTVDNRYYLQGVIKYYLGNKYYFSRDNISKEKNVNLDYEIMQFVKDVGEVSKAEIKSNFNGITEAMLLQIVARNKDIIIINEGIYMSSDNLCIIEKDYKILDLIKHSISEFPISSRKLFEIMSYDYTDFFMRNNISSHTKLFGILQYMFSDKLRFSRPFIGSFSDNEFTIINIVKKYLSNFSSIKISELMGFCKENHLIIISPTILLQQLDDYIRIDADEITRVDEVEFDDTKIQQICDTIENDVKIKGYLSAKSIDSFLYYPDINIKWNGFLLSSIVKKFSDTITVTEFYSSDIYVLNSIFIDAELEIDNYEDFLRWIIKSEHSRSPFTDINELKEWLTCEGLINVKLPKFITDTQYVYQDEYGKLIVQ